MASRLRHGAPVITILSNAVLSTLFFRRWVQLTHVAAVRGPSDLGGIDLQDLYLLQGTKKVLMIIKHFCCNSTRIKIPQVCLQWIQLTLCVGHLNVINLTTTPSQCWGQVGPTHPGLPPCSTEWAASYN